jgi:hypothetical protein
MRERDRVHKLAVLIRSSETCMYICTCAKRAQVAGWIDRAKKRREGSTRAPRPGSISETGGREVEKAWRSGRRLQKGSPARPSTSTLFLPVVDQSAHLEKTKSNISGHPSSPWDAAAQVRRLFLRDPIQPQINWSLRNRSLSPNL